MKWLEHPGSRLAHALRDHSPKVGAPGVRFSMCGGLTWHRTGRTAPPTMKRCAKCTRAAARCDTVSPHEGEPPPPDRKDRT